MKKQKIGVIKIAEIYKKIRNDFHRAIKTESNKKHIRREKNKLIREIKEYYCIYNTYCV